MYNQHTNTQGVEEVSMTTPEGESKQIPEWSIFDRLDELEDITLNLMEKADTTEPTLKETSTIARDARLLAEFAFILGFSAYIGDSSDNPIELKDKFTSVLKSQNLNEELFEAISSYMVNATKPFESK